jgi:hypothetical protein
VHGDFTRPLRRGEYMPINRIVIPRGSDDGLRVVIGKADLVPDMIVDLMLFKQTIQDVVRRSAPRRPERLQQRDETATTGQVRVLELRFLAQVDLPSRGAVDGRICGTGTRSLRKVKPSVSAAANTRSADATF